MAAIDPPAKGSVRRVQQALAALGHGCELKRFPAGTRTSEEAAAAVGCAVGQIAKSLVFRAADGDRPVLVIASGTNRVDERKVASLVAGRVARADATFVRERTGFAIGGVAPVGHKEPPIVAIDEDLLGYREVWAAAGAPDAVFRLDPRELPRLTGGLVGEVKAD